jgi:hypothetical protein
MRARVDFCLLRTREEFYDTASDPGCLKNLSGTPTTGAAMGRLKELLVAEMRRTGDPLLAQFEKEIIRLRP